VSIGSEYYRLITYLVDFVAAVLLQISADVAEEGHVKDRGSDEKKQGADENEDCKHDGD
jgi:1,4-dihydroxy-2-naphthoate octaprenyltransferase